LPYKVFMGDNFHFMDEGEGYELGALPTAEAAIAKAEHQLNAELLHLFKPGMTAEELYSDWSDFGELPTVRAVGDAPQVSWSGLSYAKQRAAAIA
jgi:hypothetical protein